MKEKHLQDYIRSTNFLFDIGLESGFEIPQYINSDF